MDRSFTIRKAVPADIPAMMALDRESLTAAHWSENQYRDLFASNRFVLCASSVADPIRPLSPSESSLESMLGFVVASPIPSEWELENIVVAPPLRRAGIATALLRYLLAETRKTQSEAVFLEVRESNQAARSFYESVGFQQTGRRKSYYNEPLEDAILYRMDVH